ncbi:GNAT family N-acetyltransferase [Pseudochrobactrum kiredjianiae]|uniref:GNAT family N-acetyltransferase n=1 Tax=Pseudochrobactrum kiredjianiae TaxID=386305 RepID=A0ABW3V1N4_9HYPH|nr:GNAT family N-acetyltransferase [Pseudochrobactrum kiredjianiae]MDM7852058.1 GNAT family N-acetyltransferase [Pseudochrobactrum kiredjianiae]
MHFHFSPAHPDDFDKLFALRLLTMRESLERIGRFDPQRALERFQNSFRPQHTRLIIVKDQLAGCVAFGAHEDDLLLEHFYIAPQFQGHGLGSLVLSQLITEAEQAKKTITLSVLQQSDAARFYEKHGFHKTGEDEWDIYYARISARHFT